MISYKMADACRKEAVIDVICVQKVDIFMVRFGDPSSNCLHIL